MKSNMFSALAYAGATLGLALAPVAAQAEDSPVSYDDAMKCSALFAVIASGAEGSDEAEFEDVQARWLVVAMNRDGTEDGSKAQSEIDSLVDDPVDTLGEFETEEEGETFLLKGLEFCEGKHEQIAEEIDGIEFEDE